MWNNWHSDVWVSFGLQSLILSIAATWIEQEKKDDVAAKEAYMAENCGKPNLSGDQAALMVRWRVQQSHFCLLFFITTLSDWEKQDHSIYSVAVERHSGNCRIYTSLASWHPVGEVVVLNNHLWGLCGLHISASCPCVLSSHRQAEVVIILA